jgi:hypothetical protein
MRSFALEVYAPNGDDDDFRASVLRLRRAAQALRREGEPIAYRQSLFLPTDETCFHVIDGRSQEAVAEAARRASLETARIVEASR